jgi:hypothetical protein
MSRPSTTDAVRNYAAINFTVSKKQVREALGLTVDQSKNAFDNLLKTGNLRRIGHGVYQFVDRIERPQAEIMDKIWRAMKVSGPFSVAEIAKLSGSTVNYVYKRFRQYRADGFIKDAGSRPTYGTGTEKLFRLTVKGKKKAHNPRVENWQPDPLALAAVNLNRLICSGVAVRDKDAAIEAMGLLKVLKKGLKDVIDET